MQMTESDIKNVLKDYKYIQHLERKIFLILVDYPNLIEDLDKYKLNGARKIFINYDHYLDEPKVVYDEKSAQCTIFINK